MLYRISNKSGKTDTFHKRIQDFGKEGGSAQLLSTKMRAICAHARNVVFPLYEVWGSPKGPPSGSAPAMQ